MTRLALPLTLAAATALADEEIDLHHALGERQRAEKAEAEAEVKRLKKVMETMNN